MALEHSRSFNLDKSYILDPIRQNKLKEFRNFVADNELKLKIKIAENQKNLDENEKLRRRSDELRAKREALQDELAEIELKLREFVTHVNKLDEQNLRIAESESTLAELVTQRMENQLMCQFYEKVFAVKLRYKADCGVFEGILRTQHGPKMFRVTSSTDFYAFLKQMDALE